MYEGCNVWRFSLDEGRALIPVCMLILLKIYKGFSMPIRIHGDSNTLNPNAYLSNQIFATGIMGRFLVNVKNFLGGI